MSSCLAPGPTLAAAPAVVLPHDEYGSQINALNWTMVAMSGMILTLRIYLKLSRRRILGWDDHILCIAWLSQTAQVIVVSVSIQLGFGKHIWDVPAQNLHTLDILGSVIGTLSLVATALSKTSFALTLLRLPVRNIKWPLWFIIITLNVTSYISAASNWIKCTEPLTGSFCMTVNAIVVYGMAAGFYCAAMDFILALLPWKFLWKLQMDKSEKIGTMIAMSMGIFAGVASILKSVQIPSLESEDITASIPLGLWGTAESAVTIAACSIPILRALLGRDIPDAYKEVERKFTKESKTGTSMPKVYHIDTSRHVGLYT
ncbi:hypothetical protein GQ53DRAFT_633211 [Thozetella sp. PMI_491]|nr:hypothetical protein GQ53DRAFT_633211 [Thozetella sp. PMI_491]